MSSIKDQYLKTILREVRFPFDRKMIRKEIEAHLDESIEDHMNPAISIETAERTAIHDFGDPVLIGKMLSKVHKPLIGWLWIISKTGFMCLLIFSITISIPSIYNTWTKTQLVHVPIGDISTIIDAAEIRNGNIKDDIFINKKIQLQDAIIYFERMILLDSGIIILIIQQVDTFKLFGPNPTEYPLRTQGRLLVDNTWISFRKTGLMNFAGRIVLVADGIKEKADDLVFDFNGYREHFSLVLELNHD